MKRFLFVLLIAALGGILETATSWWFSLALAGLLVGLFISKEKAGVVFAIGLLGGALLWGGYAAYLNISNDGLLAGRIGGAFGGLSALSMILVTAVLGGVYAGLGSLCGHYGRNLLFHDSVGKNASSVD